jgi:hypothetical protein
VPTPCAAFLTAARHHLTRHKISCREPSVHATQHMRTTADRESVNDRLARAPLHRLVRPVCDHGDVCGREYTPEATQLPTAQPPYNEQKAKTSPTAIGAANCRTAVREEANARYARATIRMQLVSHEAMNGRPMRQPASPSDERARGYKTHKANPTAATTTMGIRSNHSRNSRITLKV